MTSTGPYTQPTIYTHVDPRLPNRYSKAILDNHTEWINQQKKDRVHGKGTIMDMLSCDRQFSDFKFIVDRSGLASMLGNLERNYTIFVPDNHNMKNTPDLFFHNIDKESSRRIVLSSLMDNKLYLQNPQEFSGTMYHSKYGNDKIYIRAYDRLFFVNGDTLVKRPNVECANGLIHIVSDVITLE